MRSVLWCAIKFLEGAVWCALYLKHAARRMVRLLGTWEPCPPAKRAIVEMHVDRKTKDALAVWPHLAFEAHATASTLVTKPNLTISHTGPQQVSWWVIWFDSPFRSPIPVRTAEHVVLQEDVPPGLSHTAGRKSSMKFGSFDP